MGDVNLEIKLNNLAKNAADANTNVDEVSRVIADNGDWLKSKNLFNSIFKTITSNGVTCTNNGDGTYTLNGTASNTTTFIFDGVKNIVNWIDKKKYKLVGCPKDGGSTTYQLVAQGMATDIGEGSVFTCDITKVTESNKFYIVVFNGTTCNNIVFKPMITEDLTITYDDFVPHIKSNLELASDLATLIETLKSKGVID